MTKSISNDVLYWPLSTSSPHEADCFCFEEEGIVFGWTIDISDTLPMPSKIVICGFVLSFAHINDIYKEHRMEPTMDSIISLFTKFFANRKVNLDHNSNTSLRECFDSMEMLGIWKPAHLNAQSTTFQRMLEKHRLPFFGASPSGPCWSYPGTNSPLVKNKVCQLTFYKPGYNYRLSHKSPSNEHHHTYMLQVLMRISLVKYVRSELIYQIMKSFVNITSKGVCTNDSQIQNVTVERRQTKQLIVKLREPRIRICFSKSHCPKIISRLMTASHLMFRLKPKSNNESKTSLIWVISPLIFKIHSNYKEKLNASVASAILDQCLGVIFGSLLIFFHEDFVQFFLGMLPLLFSTSYHRIVGKCMTWLETFPVGFKLNVQLTKHMGKEIQTVVQTHTNLLTVLLKFIDSSGRIMFGSSFPLLSSSFIVSFFLHFISFSSVFYGLSIVFCVWFDMLNFLTLHIRIIRNVFGKMYHIQISTLSSLWLLFRGKKKNVLRGRTDTLELDYDYMQLLVGILLFSTFLFLFTTIFVYYFFFAFVLDVVNFVMVVACWSNWLLIRGFPVLAVWKRISEGDKDEFGKQFYFKEVNHANFPKKSKNDFIHRKEVITANRHEIRIDVIIVEKKSLSSIVLDGYIPIISSFFRKVGTFIITNLKGDPSSVISTCLEISYDLNQSEFI